MVTTMGVRRWLAMALVVVVVVVVAGGGAALVNGEAGPVLLENLTGTKLQFFVVFSASGYLDFEQTVEGMQDVDSQQDVDPAIHSMQVAVAPDDPHYANGRRSAVFPLSQNGLYSIQCEWDNSSQTYTVLYTSYESSPIRTVITDF